MKNTKTKILAEGAVMVALATVLSFLKVVQFPWGGAITVLSMLPIVVFALRYGAIKGLAVSFVYSVIQLGQGILIDGLLGWGLTPTALVACILLDYILAFSILCLAGLFGNRSMAAIIGGTVLVMLLRFGSHYLSGVLIFHSFGELWNGFSTDNTWLYSLLYNGAYMLPEAIFTTAGAVVLFKTPQMRRLLVSGEGKEEK
ncbi:MAG: proton-coupled thiamine transporter YuaJ [Ruminococcaceae bacterium]|nr:proton-coupled thiamine transporter YuaJ [Oscillospiraceae bacterium]